ncbi:MAG: hypothetical protein MJB57_17390 [Gemmatimonadetes bacterium]|nr:hypothetical protein [Gemmatimonadota bacterium]
MRPTVARTELYSYLVTRHTGRTVRTNIEEQLARVERAALAVLDLRHVPLIDFSCADEVVAKLVVLSVDARPHRRFVLFRGLAEHHLEPIESALTRQGLAAAAESDRGEPLLIGSLEPRAAAAWREIWALGHVDVDALAERLDERAEHLLEALDDLEARALVIRDGDIYVSLGRALDDAAAEEEPGIDRP